MGELHLASRPPEAAQGISLLIQQPQLHPLLRALHRGNPVPLRIPGSPADSSATGQTPEPLLPFPVAVEVVVDVVQTAALGLGNQHTGLFMQVEARPLAQLDHSPPDSCFPSHEPGPTVSVIVDKIENSLTCRPGHSAPLPQGDHWLPGHHAFPLELRELGSERLLQPLLKLPPQRLQILAKRAAGIAVDPERYQIVAVCLHQPARGILTVPLRQITVEIDSVEIVRDPGRPAAQRKIHLLQRFQPAQQLQAHQHAIVGTLPPPVTTLVVGFHVGRQPLLQPGRLQDVGKQKRITAEHPAQSGRDSSGLIQMQHVAVFMNDEQLEPVITVGQFPDVVGYHRKEQHPGEGRDRGHTVRPSRFIRQYQLDRLLRLPTKPGGEDTVYALGDLTYPSRERFLACGKVDTEMGGAQGTPLQGRIHRRGLRVPHQKEQRQEKRKRNFRR